MAYRVTDYPPDRRKGKVKYTKHGCDDEVFVQGYKMNRIEMQIAEANWKSPAYVTVEPDRIASMMCIKPENENIAVSNQNPHPVSSHTNMIVCFSSDMSCE